MHVLFIAPRLPLPADTGGKIRTFNIIKQIANNNKLDLVCFSFSEDDQKILQEFKDLNIDVKLVPMKDDSTAKKILQVLTNPLPYTAAKYYSPSMEQAIADLLMAQKYDVIHFDHIHMAHYHNCFNGVPCVLDEHNVEYKILERCADVETNFFKRMLFSSQAKKMESFEGKIIKEFSSCSGVSEDDCNILKELLGSQPPIHVVPNGVDTEYFDCPKSSNEEEAVVFTGSMDWFPNEDSALFFCQDILPLIWEKNPEVKFYIVGKNPSAKLQECAKNENRVILTGRVDDVRDYVVRSKIFVVPLRIGGGTRLKILEALSMRKAVVSTSVGAEGIEYNEDENIVLADKPQAFAQKILDLLVDERKRNTLGEKGRELVLAKYDWNIVGKKIHAIYEDMIHAK